MAFRSMLSGRTVERCIAAFRPSSPYRPEIARQYSLLTLDASAVPVTSWHVIPFASYSSSTSTAAAAAAEIQNNNTRKVTGANFEGEPLEGPNPGLTSVISQGVTSLERTATQVQVKTKQSSLPSSTSSSSTSKEGRRKKKINSTPRQLAEAQRILDVATECLEELCEQQSPNSALSLLTIGGEAIVLLEVQVNSNARQAKVFWTLPYGILTDERLTPTLYQQLMKKIESHLLVDGVGKRLARQVHNRLRYYYPPKLKFQMATPEMVTRAMEELLPDE